MPPGRDSGPGGRQPLGKASHQRKQEKHQGGTGLWGTVPGGPEVPLRLEIACLDWLGASCSIRQPALTWLRRGAGLRPRVRWV